MEARSSSLNSNSISGNAARPSARTPVAEHARELAVRAAPDAGDGILTVSGNRKDEV